MLCSENSAQSCGERAGGMPYYTPCFDTCYRRNSCCGTQREFFSQDRCSCSERYSGQLNMDFAGSGWTNACEYLCRRNDFWPEFTHPRWLEREELYYRRPVREPGGCAV